ncbi:hypothetical protein H7K62_14255 [Quadrisphaera sp. RL12-1S]|uniref:hypothetical protein n=1 Tax=Quadrisphaera sp. RL12-1S TaxID=2763011 RepID=UPI00164899FE|nr:hypothetical protein [Quadrisphaera sp. RL12-1S]MBC3762857.1 hypothetical protein [Quadrisphaera sp. RL12-1S]
MVHTTTTLPSTPTIAAAGGSPAGPAGAPRRRRRAGATAAPLGSLLQATSARPACPACGADQLTVLSMTLTDGTAVRFSSCRGCEHRQWDAQDTTLTITEVLERSRG